MLVRNKVDNERKKARAAQYRLEKYQEEERAQDIALSFTNQILKPERQQYDAEVQRLMRQIVSSKTVELHNVKALEAQNMAVEKHRNEIEHQQCTGTRGAV